MEHFLQYLPPLLFGLSLAGLTSIVIRALLAGSEAYSGAYSESTAREFEDVFMFIPPKRLEEIRWASAAVFFLIGFMLTGSFSSAGGFAVGFFFGLLTGGVALFMPTWILTFLKTRRLAKFNSQLVDTLVGMSNALKAGFSIAQAFEAVVKDGENPIAQEFDVFLQQTRVGVSFADALNNMDERVGSQDLTLVVMAIETARKTGGNLTEILEAIAKTIRERMRIENRIKTLTAQGRLQGIVVSLMPIIITVLLLIVDGDTMRPFLRSLTGLAIMAVVGILILCGGLIIRKIIRIDV